MTAEAIFRHAGQLPEPGASEASLRGFLHGLPGVDQVGAEARAAALATRSIKTTAKAWAIDMAISMVGLTTLEGSDTPGKVRALCAKARRPDPTDASVPPVAAVCAEIAPWLASHMDVNALDLTGAEAVLAVSLEVAAADNLKRVIRPHVEDLTARPGIDRMLAVLETKTVWHPIGV